MIESLVLNKTEISGLVVERTAKRMKQCFQKMLKDAGTDITVDQWVIVHELHRNNTLSQFEIAKLTFKDAPTVTRIIDLLCKKGLTKRQANKDDRRKFNIILTKKGVKKIEEVRPIVQGFREQAWANISERKMNQLVDTLNLVFRNLEG